MSCCKPLKQSSLAAIVVRSFRRGLVFSGVSQNPGAAMMLSSSWRRRSRAGRSKILLDLVEAVADVLQGLFDFGSHGGFLLGFCSRPDRCRGPNLSFERII
jgi:hypothetical protein